MSSMSDICDANFILFIAEALEDHKFKCLLRDGVSDCHTCLRLFVLKYKKDMG